MVITDAEVSIGAGILMYGLARMRDKWMHIAHIYTGTNVQVYVNGTIRRDWFKDDIFTGKSLPFTVWSMDRRR